MNHTNRIIVTVNLLIFTVEDGVIKLILIKRANNPFVGYWALPGGAIDIKESLDSAAKRVLLEETGVHDVYLEQLYTFGDPNRDPRERRVNVSYFALIPSENIRLHAAGKAWEAKWTPVKKMPKLAFDHKLIVEYGIDRLKSKMGYSNLAFGLLDKSFRLSELQKVYEIVLGRKLDKRNFRKKMLALNLLRATGRKEIDGAHRPAMLYSFINKEVVVFD